METSQQRFSHLDLNLLRVLKEIYLHRQLSLAADNLALSPSAISHALRRLRAHFDDPLFVRHGRSMIASPYCEHIAPKVIEYLSALQAIFSTPQDFDPASATMTFSLGMPDALEATLLPKLQQLIQRDASHCELRSVPFARHELKDLLTQRAIDVAIDVARPARSPLKHQAYIQDCFAVLSAANIPLNKVEEYLNHQHIAVSGRAHGVVLEDVSLLRSGIERRIALRCQSYQSAAQIVAQSDLLLTAPSLVAARLAEQYRLQMLPLPFPQPNIELHLYWHQQDHDTPAHQWLRNKLLQIVRR